MEKNENFDNFLIFFEIFDLFLTIFSQLGIDSVPGRPGTEDFVPGFLLLSLSRDKGTSGQGNIFVPGQRDNGTSRPRLSRDVPRDVPSLGNPSSNTIFIQLDHQRKNKIV
jgi:hypothetical protein